MRDLYAGVQSLIQGDGTNAAELADDIQLTKPGLLASEATEQEEKQLYEVLPEVGVAAKDGQIFGSKHGYQIPSNTTANAAGASKQD